MRAEQGFTLLEVLIALVIFALLGLAAYAGLDAVLKARARLDAENRQWRAVALFWTRLGRDLAACVDRPARLQGGAPRPSVQGEAVAVGEDGAQLELTRLGDGEGIQGAPRRVGYRLRAGRVEWLHWPAPDAGPRARPETGVLVEHAAALEFAYRDAVGVWSARWPVAPGQPLPGAVKVVLRLNTGEAITRWYAF